MQTAWFYFSRENIQRNYLSFTGTIKKLLNDGLQIQECGRFPNTPNSRYHSKMVTFLLLKVTRQLSHTRRGQQELPWLLPITGMISWHQQNEKKQIKPCSIQNTMMKTWSYLHTCTLQLQPASLCLTIYHRQQQRFLNRRRVPLGAGLLSFS